MSQMHTVATWTSTCVKVERLSLFITIENTVEFSEVIISESIRTNLAINLWEKNIPRLRYKCGLRFVSFSNLSKSALSIALVPN